MRICFYSNLSSHANWREMFEKVEFYRVDIRILKELGNEVTVAGVPSALDLKADLYFCWWWGHATLPLLAGKLRRKPVIVTGAFDYATCRQELPGLCYLDRPLWQRAVLRSVLRLADRNLFISKYEFDEVTANLRVRNPACVPPAIDTEYYRPEGPSSGRGNYFFAVAWTGRANAIRKGLPNTLDAFASVSAKRPDLRFIVAGKRGDYAEALMAQASKLGIGSKVEFIGMISDEEKRRRYRECVAYVQPTLYEGFGHAIGEAIASGARVITSPSGAVTEVAGSFATLVDPRDIPGISAAMRGALDDAQDPGRQASQHRWIERRFSIETRKQLLKEYLG